MVPILTSPTKIKKVVLLLQLHAAAVLTKILFYVLTYVLTSALAYVLTLFLTLETTTKLHYTKILTPNVSKGPFYNNFQHKTDSRKLL
jgi:hypothetical protein